MLVSDLGADPLHRHPRRWSEALDDAVTPELILHLSGEQADRVVVIHSRIKWISVFTRQVAFISPSPLERGTPGSHPDLLGPAVLPAVGDAKCPSIPPTLSCGRGFRNV